MPLRAQPAWVSFDHPLFCPQGERESFPSNISLSNNDVEYGQALLSALFSTSISPLENSSAVLDVTDVTSSGTQQPIQARASSTAVLDVSLFSCFEMLIKLLALMDQSQLSSNKEIHSPTIQRPQILFLTAFTKAELHRELHDRKDLWKRLSNQCGGMAKVSSKLNCIEIR